MIKLNPTRLELSTRKRKLAQAQKGHRLLKDKADELSRILSELKDGASELRAKVDLEFVSICDEYEMFCACGESPELGKNIVPIKAKKTYKNIMGVSVPILEFTTSKPQELDYDLLVVSAVFDGLLKRAEVLSKNMLLLAEKEGAILAVEQDCKSTRRRANSLEYSLIPRLIKEMKYIASVLEERERGNVIRAMQIKKSTD